MTLQDNDQTEKLFSDQKPNKPLLSIAPYNNLHQMIHLIKIKSMHQKEILNFYAMNYIIMEEFIHVLLCCP